MAVHSAFALSTSAFSTSSFAVNRFRPHTSCSKPTYYRVAPIRIRAEAAEPEPPSANVNSTQPDLSIPELAPKPRANAPTSAPQSESQTPANGGRYPEREVPGKIQLDELAIAKQRTVLEGFAKELRKKRIEEDREAARVFGWVPFAETLNGRLAMFFIMTGLLTEYWTGYTLPDQLELILRTLGII